jgi:hypothetical protein
MDQGTSTWLWAPLVIAAASVKPEDAASNISAWAHWVGFVDVPAWLSAPSADSKVILGALGLALVYCVVIFLPPALRQANPHYREVVETFGTLDEQTLRWIKRMAMGLRPVGIPDDIWQRLERTGYFEKDFQGPRGIVADARPIINDWLRRNRGTSSLHTWGPWVLIIGGPLIGLVWLWLRPVDLKVSVAQTAPPPMATPAPPATPAFPPRDQSKRETSTQTIRQLKALYEGRTALQAEALIKPFKGLWIDAEGEIILINANPAVLLKSGDDMVECWFSKEWVNVLGRYSLHQNLKIRGKISDTQNGAQIYLTDCEVIGVTPI